MNPLADTLDLAAKWSDLHLHPEADGMHPCFEDHAARGEVAGDE